MNNYNQVPQALAGISPRNIGEALSAAQDRPPTQIESEFRQLEGNLNILGESWNTHCDRISGIIQPYPATPLQNEKEPQSRCPVAERLRRLNIQLSQVIVNIQQTTKQVEL